MSNERRSKLQTMDCVRYLFTRYAICIFKKDYSTNGLFSLRYNYMALRLLKITLAEDIKQLCRYLS